MWVFTQHGFISAVDNNHVPGKLAVRARDKESLELLADLAEVEIVSSTRSDYPYRVYVTREQFIEFLVAHVETLDYSNFKNRIYQTRGPEFAEACGDVWGAMLQVTDEEARGLGLYS